MKTQAEAAGDPNVFEEPSMAQKDYEALANFRYVLRKFFRFSEDAAAEAGLTPQQYQGLLAIQGFPGGGPMTIGDMAERLQFRHNSAVALVDRMVHAGLVARQTASEDRRQVHVILTEKGHALLYRLSWVHREELRRLEPHLSEMSGYLRGDQ